MGEERALDTASAYPVALRPLTAWICNKCAKFHENILSQSENIANSFSVLIDSPRYSFEGRTCLWNGFTAGRRRASSRSLFVTTLWRDRNVYICIISYFIFHIKMYTTLRHRTYNQGCKSKCMRGYRQAHVHLSLYQAYIYNLKSIANNEINRTSEALQQTQQLLLH